MAITIHLQVGESIHQALAGCVRENYSGGDGKTIVIPPGVSIVGSSIRQTRIIGRRTTGIPFLYGDFLWLKRLAELKQITL